jgi:hypothetical protein
MAVREVRRNVHPEEVTVRLGVVFGVGRGTGYVFRRVRVATRTPAISAPDVEIQVVYDAGQSVRLDVDRQKLVGYGTERRTK